MLVRKASDSSKSAESLSDKHSESEGSNSVIVTEDLIAEGIDSETKATNEIGDETMIKQR